MKTLFLVLITTLLVLTSTIAFTENDSGLDFGFLNVHGSFEFGILTLANKINVKKSANLNQLIYKFDYLPYFTFETYLLFFKVIKIGGSIRSVFMTTNDIMMYCPRLNKYTIYIEILFNRNFKISFEHYCEHDTTVNYVNTITIEYDKTANILNTSETKIYAKLEF